MENDLDGKRVDADEVGRGISKEPLYFSILQGVAIYNRSPTTEEIEKFESTKDDNLTSVADEYKVDAMRAHMRLAFVMAKVAATENAKNEVERNATLQALDRANRWGKLVFEYEKILRVGKGLDSND